MLHLSAMTAEEARETLAAHAGEHVCVRYSCDAQDNVVFAPPRPAPLRAAALATALAACTGSEGPIAPEPPVVAIELDEVCDEQQPASEGPELCEGEVAEVIEEELFEGTVEGGVVGWVEGRVMGAMVVPVIIATPPPLPEPARPMQAAEAPWHPRHVVPLDTWMGAVPPDLLAGAVPRRRDEE